MAEQPAWAGKVTASLENGQATGLQLKQNDVISVVAKGYIKFGPDDTEWSDPQSPIPTHKTTFERNPALVAMIGGNTTKPYPIGNGVLDWNVPADGELFFKFVDKPGTYNDNTGAFDVTVVRENTSAKPVAWSGTLQATAEKGVQTGDTVSQGDVISVTVTGKATAAPGWPLSGPEGYDPSKYPPSGAPALLLSSANIGAVLMRIGSGQLKVVGSGLSNHTVQEDGEITFLYNDQTNGFGDNTGSFEITLSK